MLGTLMAVEDDVAVIAARCWARTLPTILLLAAIGSVCAWLMSLSWAATRLPGHLLSSLPAASFLLRYFLARIAA